MTRTEVVALIEHAIANAGSARQLALDWGISAMYLCDVRHGRRDPGPSILKVLKLTKQVSYNYVCLVNLKTQGTRRTR